MSVVPFGGRASRISAMSVSLAHIGSGIERAPSMWPASYTTSGRTSIMTASLDYKLRQGLCQCAVKGCVLSGSLLRPRTSRQMRMRIYA